MKDRLKKRGNFDDNEASIDKRINSFLEKTKPLIDKWNAVKIDAEKSSSEVFDQLMGALEKDHALKLFETVQIAWKTGGVTSKVWVVDDFPFPIKAETFKARSRIKSASIILTAR